MTTRLSTLTPDVAQQLTGGDVRALLHRFASGPDALPSFDPDDVDAVVRALCFRHVPLALADALADLTRLSTEVGREAILELLGRTCAPAAASGSRDLHALAPVSLAVRVLCARGIPRRRARGIVLRALVRVGRHFSPYAWYTLVTESATLLDRPELLLDAAREVYGESLVDAFLVGPEDGVLRAVVLHRAPAIRIVRRRADGRRRGVNVRPDVCDVIRWDARGARLSFSLARPSLLPHWVEAIARLAPVDAAHASPSHVFSERPALTLKSLHEKGASWLERIALPAGVTKLEVIAAEADDGRRVRLRNDGALAGLHHILGRARGYLRTVTFRATLDAPHATVDFTIDVPWKVIVSDPRHEEIVRLLMDALAIHDAGALPDDLPSLVPMQPEWRWTDVVTAAGFARAVAAKILTRVRGKRPSGREHRIWGALVRGFDIPGEDAAYVVGEDLAIPAFDAKPETFDWYAIEWTRVAAALQKGIGLSDPRVTDPPAGLLSLGEQGAEGNRVAVFSMIRAFEEAEIVPLLKQLRKACGRATPALLVPRGRSLGGAVAEILVTPGEQLGVDDVAWIAARIADECGQEEDIALSRFATAASPLVLSVARQEAWYGEVQLHLTENQLAMLFALARAPGWMKATELGMKINPGAGFPDQIVRKARLSLKDRLVASFEKANVKIPVGLSDTLVRFEASKGYRLGVNAIVR